MNKEEKQIDALSILNAVPGNYLILSPDVPLFTIVGATDSYLKSTYTIRENIIGKSLFEVFPDNPATSEATGVKNLKQSLTYVAENRKEHRMLEQRYDVINPQNGMFEFKVWSPLNKPVFDGKGEVQYIIHWVEDITQKAKLKQALKDVEVGKKFEESEARFRSLIKAAPVGIGLFVGPTLTIEMANQAFKDIANKDDSVIGMPFEQAIPELNEKLFLNVFNKVYTKGQILHTTETPVKSTQKGIENTRFYDFSYTPLFDENDKVYAILNIAVDVTERVLGRKALEKSETNLRNTILQAPVAMCILKGPSYVVEIANTRMFEIWGRGASELMNKPLFESLPEAGNKGYEELLHGVYSTGETFSGSERPITVVRQGKSAIVYVNYVYEPLREGDGTITGVIAVATDVSEQVAARKKIEENELELQSKVAERTASLEQQKTFVSSILEASFNGIYALTAIYDQNNLIVDFRYLFVNKNIAQLLQKSVDEIIGKTILELIPENKTNGFFDAFCTVLQTGTALRNETHFITDKINHWFDYVIIPTDKNTLVVTLQDITKQKQATIQIEQQRNLLDNIMKFSPIGISVTEMIRNDTGEVIDGKTIIANLIAEKYSGISLEQMLSKTVLELNPAILNSPLFVGALHTLTTGESFASQYYYEPNSKWLEISVSKMDENRLINIFNDVTTLKNAQLQIERSEERLKAVFNNAQSGMFTFTPVEDERGEIIDFKFVITNAYFAAYIGQTPEVLVGALGSTWFPGYLQNGVFEMYKKTYLTGKSHRMDTHYNVDGLDLYLDINSAKVGSEVFVTINDYSSLKKAQFQLEKYVEDLKRSNANLEDFAYAASHDLKEPIRKIRTFADLIKQHLKERLLKEDLNYFDRMEKATERMQTLINDLLEYSHVATPTDSFDQINLNKKVTQVLEDLELEVAEKKAKITVGELPVIKGHRRQIQQIFQNLITNALKFNKPGTSPEIEIKSSVVKGDSLDSFMLPEELKNKLYNRIEFSDKGIGFEQEYADKIFKMFHRLHSKAEYEGTGIGLAIVRKVVENHKGFIRADSVPGKGTTFTIIFPVE